ncbi:coproporphyrinogen-III oxidase family protein [Paenibacillus xylanexedens]|uniref:coproporphyrinogen-III oxidase family protein n=1 Tax=Paenibacillus xylanexedens TaxID=528191 RepID=UPI0011A001BC|nr:coproporphyrinogen-III oxidase family protein [Paenibacillus xylanexedens]
MELTLKRETFVTTYPPYSVLSAKNVSTIWERRPINVYVHLPFCPKRCNFCYYRIEESKGGDEVTAYVNVLLQEIALLRDKPEIQSCSMQTLYFGGGTPTMLSSEHFIQIMEALEQVFPKTPDFEFNVEVRPGGEATQEKLDTLKRLGVHRVSIGVQSLDDVVLKENGRNHLSNMFYGTYERVRQAGFDWVNCDIMSGMLHESEESWKSTVRLLSEIRPENISIYKMEVFFNTKLFRKLRQNPDMLVSDDAEAANFRWARKFLEAEGYFMWNNSSFVTSPKYIHKHRQNVQYGAEMLGIGLSSHSYFLDSMFQNTADMNEYVEKISKGELPISRSYKLSKQDQITRYIVMSLKNLTLSREHFIENFGLDITSVLPAKIEELTSQGLIHLDEKQLYIDPEYYDFADDVARFFYPEHLQEDMLAHISRKG